MGTNSVLYSTVVDTARKLSVVDKTKSGQANPPPLQSKLLAPQNFLSDGRGKCANYGAWYCREVEAGDRETPGPDIVFLCLIFWEENQRVNVTPPTPMYGFMALIGDGPFLITEQAYIT